MLHSRLRAAAGNRGGIPQNGLVTHYTMENISGSSLIDETGNHNGTIYGATAGVDNLNFDGTNDRVDNSSTGRPSLFAFCLNITPDVIGIEDSLVDNVSGTGRVMMRIDLGFLQFYSYTTSFTILQHAVTAGQNYRIVAQHDGINVDLWVNGVLQDSANTGQIQYLGSESGRRIGASYDLDVIRFYNGKFFEFAEYSRALTSSEILEHFS